MINWRREQEAKQSSGSEDKDEGRVMDLKEEQPQKIPFSKHFTLQEKKIVCSFGIDWKKEGGKNVIDPLKVIEIKSRQALKLYGLIFMTFCGTINSLISGFLSLNLPL